MNAAFAGKRVLVTRPKNRGGKLVEKLEKLGAIPILLPATEIAEATDLNTLDQALVRLGEFDWLIFTSPNGVEAVGKRLDFLGISLDQFPATKIAVVGPSTAEAVALLGRAPDAMPEKFVSDEIARAIPNLAGTRILLARGDLARREFPEELSRMGATVLDVTAYRILRSEGACNLNEENMPDVITVMSGESARATIEQLRDCGLDEWLLKVPIACIGPVTAACVQEEQLRPAIVAEEHTVDGLLQSLERMFSGAFLDSYMDSSGMEHSGKVPVA